MTQKLVDVLITHDAPAGVPLTGDFKLPAEAEARASETRVLLRRVVDQLQPKVLFAGHWHQREISELGHESGRSTTVHVLADENSRAGNAVLLWPGSDPLRVDPLLVKGS